MLGRRALLAGGLLSAGIALLHVVIIFVGAPAYRYFGAGEQMAQQAEAGSHLPALVTAAVTLFFALFAYYALAVAQVVPRPPRDVDGCWALVRGFVRHQAGSSALRCEAPARTTGRTRRCSRPRGV
jgi:hypothetical protein